MNYQLRFNAERVAKKVPRGKGISFIMWKGASHGRWASFDWFLNGVHFSQSFSLGARLTREEIMAVFNEFGWCLVPFRVPKNVMLLELEVVAP